MIYKLFRSSQRENNTLYQLWKFHGIILTINWDMRTWTWQNFTRHSRKVKIGSSLGLFKSSYLKNYSRYSRKILHTLLNMIKQHLLQISSNSEMVDLEAFVELAWNDPLIIWLVSRDGLTFQMYTYLIRCKTQIRHIIMLCNTYAQTETSTHILK